MDESFPGARVKVPPGLLKGRPVYSRPDDRHVLAAAIMARANTIVTQNAGEELMNRVLGTICAALLDCCCLRLRSLRTQAASQYSTVTASSSRCRRISTPR